MPSKNPNRRLRFVVQPRLLGDSICRIEVGYRDIEFHFNTAGFIRLEGEPWILRDGSGRIVDQSIDVLPSAPQHARTHELLATKVSEVLVEPEGAFALRFVNGYCLTIWNSTPPGPEAFQRK